MKKISETVLHDMEKAENQEVDDAELNLVDGGSAQICGLLENNDENDDT